MNPSERDPQEPPKALLDAIEEEVKFSTPPGAKPIEARVANAPREPMRQMITRMVKKPRTLVLLVLLLAVVVELATVHWTETASETLKEQRDREAAERLAAHGGEAPSAAEATPTQAEVPPQPEQAVPQPAVPSAPTPAAPAPSPAAPR